MSTKQQRQDAHWAVTEMIAGRVVVWRTGGMTKELAVDANNDWSYRDQADVHVTVFMADGQVMSGRGYGSTVVDAVASYLAAWIL